MKAKYVRNLFQALRQTFKKALCRGGANLKKILIGVWGGWGRGKVSFVNLVSGEKLHEF